MHPELVGRDLELGALRRAIAEGARVLSIRGPAGAGKTAVARALEPDAFVALEDVVGEAALVTAVAGALGVTLPTEEGPGREQRLVAALAARAPLRLVLDGVDRNLVAMSQALARWRKATPDGVVFVVTSQRAFEGADHTCALAALALPAPGASPEEALAAPAVRLFLEHARARSGFSPSPADVPGLVELVRALDGLPLALVLGAARVGLLGVEKTRALLARRFELLVRAGDRSLEAAIASSWELCAPAERALLARAAAFRGGFTLEGAHAVAAEPGSDELATLAALESLVAASLLVLAAPASEGRGARFGMFESVREFAQRAASPDELRAATERHATFYADEAERAAARVRGPDGAQARRFLIEEHANIARAAECKDALVALRAALALEPTYLARGPLAEHIERVKGLVARVMSERFDDDAHAPLAARAITSLGLSEIYAGRRELGVERLQEGLALAEMSGASAVAALAATKTALILGLTGSLDESRALSARAEAFAREANDPHLVGMVAKDRGMVLAEAGDNAAAIAAFDAALAGFRAAGDAREEAFTRAAIGARYLDDGALAEAKRHTEEAARMLRELGDQRTQAWALLLLAIIALDEGQLDGARTNATRALELVRAVGDRLTEGLALAVLGHADLEAGRANDAMSRYERATECLESMADRRNAAIVLGAWAAASAAAGERAHAERLLARADEHTRARGRPGDSEAVALFAAAVAARDAEHAAARGDADEARRKLASAQTTVASCDTNASLHRSDEVRLALRVARRAAADVAPRIAAMLTDAPMRRGAEAALVVAEDGKWLRLPSGEIHKLRARPVAARLLRVLVDRALEAPGEPVPAARLIEAGWPGEKILPKAAHNRLYVAMTRLRQLGLSEIVKNEGDGYFLAPDVAVRIARDEGDSP